MSRRRPAPSAPEPETIVVQGAREHNLDVNHLEIPKRKLVVVTGVSGSGKSSLAFDTLYAEGQRRYVESLSSYARQFLGQMDKPRYEHIRGLSPTIAIQQKSASSNPRSTVGTVTEIYDYLRVLYARVGEQRCHQCGGAVSARSAAEIVHELERLPARTRITVLAPKVENRKGEFRELFEDARRAGFARARIDGMVVRLEDVQVLEKKKKHSIELVVDRLAVTPDDVGRLTDSVETAVREGSGRMLVLVEGEQRPRAYSQDRACPECGIGFPELAPQSFSFNSPLGMCGECNGLGTRMAASPELVVPNEELSINQGAIAPWSGAVQRDSGWTSSIIKALAKAYRIDLDQPWNELPSAQRKIVLYGTAGKRVNVTWKGKSGGGGSWAMRFEGVIPQLERRYRETSSERMRAHYDAYFRSADCPACDGTRLRPESRAVVVADKAIDAVCALTVGEAAEHVDDLRLSGAQAQIAGEVLKEIRARLSFLLDVGLEYLTLHRNAASLSGGEAQRIRLASQLGSELSGVLYVLDEPSIGLHQRDNERLIRTLHRLRDLGNTVLVVEHDEATIDAADHVVDFGPGAGRHGGRVIAEGPPETIRRAAASLTGQYLAGTRRIEAPETRRQPRAWLELEGARENNLKDVDVAVPLGVFVAVTGVSGAGKSSLMNGTLYPALRRKLHQANERVGPYRELRGLDEVDKVIVIDQNPIGRTPRSNPATYTKAFDHIRQLFAQTQQARTFGYTPGRFSFNVTANNGGGRCEACEGAGVREVEMHFLANVYVTCEVCKGKRYNDATLRVTYKDRSIADLLDTPIDEALELFAHHRQLAKILQTLVDVGLGYLSLGQSATTLSGGEAQRVKLSRELAKRSTGRTLYFLDEPTTGLHFEDVNKLLAVLGRLVDGGNTVVVIEHNLDVIKTADWLIDLGPEGGDRGGRVIAAGPPEQVAGVPGSYTGAFLRELLSAPRSTRRRNAGGKGKGKSNGASNGAKASAHPEPDRARGNTRRRARGDASAA